MIKSHRSILKTLLSLNRATVKCTLLAAIFANLTACGSLGVEPWERDLLATKAMALTSSPIDAALDDHIYFSKEASSGGKSFGGGGCGCN
ncbi:DUF4266 domain-containing protein [Colwellia piezophila]|uniref:DUF4266 domain-containing protein n=1 Tax=Colwellia piezophila TaxID=211668 RepID=UPI00037CB579|nr:DUF4266 domain-containing protein [Colwellia piezophila]